MKIIVIGHGMVGHKFLESLATGGRANLQVTVLCEEPRPAYDRVHLSEFFSGKTAEDLSLVKPGFFEQNDSMVLRLNTRATAIDLKAKTVTTGEGEVLPYDKLVIATGSFPFVPPLPGKDRKDCFVYRTIEDLEAMLECGQRAKTGVVIGGGLLGLECAKALRDMKLDTHVVEFSPRLMAVQVDDHGGRVLRRKIEELGVTVHTGKNTTAIVDGTEATHRMEFADGGHLEADMIVFSAGIRPRDMLAKEAGLAIGPRGGIEINNNCVTSDPHVYAIGECALWGGLIFGLVAPGYEMARVAARHMLGEAAEFAGADMSTKLKLMGVDVASIGDPHGKEEGSHAYQFIDERKQIYKKIVVSSCGKYLLGGVMVGDASEYGTLLQMMLNKIELPESPEFLILPQSDGAAKPALGVDALPDSAQICSCNNISKGQLCAAVQNGATTIGELKSCTTAGTACGGCVPLVTQVMKAEMKKQGMEVNNHVCEHFAYSRQELFHLIKVGKISTFNDLLHKHGKGLGCDVCKPLAASILATINNEFVLKKEHASLQDTNDYFLGNIQKDGTYSVVPRMPAGEVTPDGLIAVGQVAKKYGLYTKITGGARVDLFGARVEQLPLIWEELIAAGFESGHAYGKSLRTVKSCVGSTWCRYGVDDSIGLAIELENRYKGLRTPHKIKFGVSGCTRECAEAQGKDVGVIATEKGWNLYVAGNGGMKPRHAELLATELDKETLVRYIDRFLMFYSRTGDRLQRTSTWRENLEGGLDYLKDVIVKDKLGIGAELEADMQHVVDTYACEWKEAVENPETRKRFRHFVNSDKADENVVFMEERGQIRPATIEERKRVIPIAVNAA
ncbi:nitrite reductase (NADH) large subunit [Duganella sp. 1224]|uniref:nitrite reductase large subunit NirB n=1 Tax=Duganella sp. 1224 TaxID=2587052 RepID=UPI0015CCAFEE|nr:nitrite reductase large subunit NirB [Duganella sp. 1224]NYE63119.1 nitrite reductase (NADH) large subunit [Duganella sp. 1224]